MAFKGHNAEVSPFFLFASSPVVLLADHVFVTYLVVGITPPKVFVLRRCSERVARVGVVVIIERKITMTTK